MGGGRAPCCDKNNVKRGPWSPAEDMKLAAFIQKNGHANWRSLPKQAGLLRCGKSCRLRWINYLSPSVKRGNFTSQEEEAIIKLHDSYGNRWSKIAAELPGRTDNEIKNVWNTHLKKRLLGKYSKCHSNNIKTKNDEDSSLIISSSSLSSSTATSNTCGEVPCPEHNRLLTSDLPASDQCPAVTLMPDILTEIPTNICPDTDTKETSRTSSFSSLALDFSSSTTQVCNHPAQYPGKEMESLFSYSEEGPNSYLEESKRMDILDILDTDFDIRTVLEDFEKFESQQEQQPVPSRLQGSTFGDENYIINHDTELAEKSEWYKYLENNDIGLMGITGEEDQKISQNKKAENGFYEEMSLEPDMNYFQCWPPSPHNC